MKIAVCDDNFEFRQSVIKYLKDYFECEIQIFEFVSAEEMLASYEGEKEYDIVFLDVEMEKMSGIDAGIKIREYDKKVIIIFVSNYSKYAIPAYECEPLYFILKPLEAIKFNKIMNKAMEKYSLLHSYYIIKNRSYITKIPINEILYVEICRKHLIFHTFFGKYEAVGKISEALKKLAPYGFCQIHQGYIVNMNHIKGFEKFDVVMSNGERVMLSTRKKSEVLKIYAGYMERIY